MASIVRTEEQIIESYGVIHVGVFRHTLPSPNTISQNTISVGDLFLLLVERGEEIPMDNLYERLNDEVWEAVGYIEDGY